jgi:pimeloyl-ACP methyl ester carboxylesterase
MAPATARSSARPGTDEPAVGPAAAAPATPGPSAADPPLHRWRRSSRRAAGSVLSPGGLRGTAVEVAWLSTHIATYPLGLARERIRVGQEQHSIADLPLSHRGLYHHDVVAAGTPIILVHGVVDNRSVFTKLKRALRRRGFGRIVTVNYSLLTGDIRQVARRLDEVVEHLVHETGYERVHIVGHSMGGLIARYYVQRLGGDHRVHTVVTLGTPHAGTLPARAVPHPLARQMRPDSDLVAELAAPCPGCRTRFLAVWSDLDLMIMPKASARMVHPDLQVRTMFVPGVGHMSLAIDGRVVHEVCTTLALLDEHGEPIPPG